MKLTRWLSLTTVALLSAGAGCPQQSGPSAVRKETGVLVRSLAFSEDGKTLTVHWGDVLRAGETCHVAVDRQDLATGQVERTLEKSWSYEWSVTAAPLSENGRVLAVAVRGTEAGNDAPTSEVLLWDTAAGKRVQTLSAPAGPVTALRLSPDGGRVALVMDESTAEQTAGRLLVWAVASGRSVASQVDDDWRLLSAVGFSPDGRTLAVRRAAPRARAKQDGPSLVLWEVTTGRERFAAPFDDNITSLTYRADGKRLAAAGLDLESAKTPIGWVFLWDVAAGKPLPPLSAAVRGIRGVAFRPNSDHIAAISADGKVVFWEVATGRELSILDGVGKVGEAIAFSPDGKKLAAGGGRVKIWEVDEVLRDSAQQKPR
jgi:WD40 repeat protein